ncbi:MAG TPA: two-component regulator propeller domain-containing protein, partial [Verrucomicrobiae bacterium]|nr:two-component regulator propeller domain-containing protein [Verrucomicrobiae bacterium]
MASPASVYPVIQAIFQDREGALWFGTLGGLARWDGHNWNVFTTGDGLPANDVRAIAEDANSNIWIGTVAGLSRLRNGRFVSFHKQDGLPSDDISSLLMGANGDFWVATGGGLARFDKGKFKRFLLHDSPFDRDVGYLIEDGRGELWMGSYAGLTRVANKSLDDFANGLTNFIPYRTYGRQDGLPNSECTQGSQPGACRARDGTLWFPTINGLAYVNPARLTTNSQPPLVVIESVTVDGQELYNNGLRAPQPQTIVIPPGKERLDIRYTSLNLAAPEWARFKYRMEGHEKFWFNAGDSRVASYSKLPPGHYQFHVAACNEDGFWNVTGSTLTIIVEPPFWRTWWFISGTTLGFLGIVVMIVRYVSTQKLQRQLASLRQQEALERERARIARDLHDQLGASLTQVSLLGEMVETDKDSPGEV